MYCVEVNGIVNYNRNLTIEELDALKQFILNSKTNFSGMTYILENFDIHYKEDAYKDGFHFNRIELNDSYIFYDAFQNFSYLVEYFFQPKGIKLDGYFNCIGEEANDEYKMIFKDYEITVNDLYYYNPSAEVIFLKLIPQIIAYSRRYIDYNLFNSFYNDEILVLCFVHKKDRTKTKELRLSLKEE